MKTKNTIKIVITDGHALNPGDLDWSAFDALGDVAYYDRTPASLVTERCREATVIITNKTVINRETIEQATGLKLITVTATGYNTVNTEAARQKQVTVSNVPVYSTDSVAQHVFALLLALTNKIPVNAADVSNGGWVRSADWGYTVQPMIELGGKTMGIVGFGRIGQRVAALAAAFGMKVIFYNKGKQSVLARAVSLEELFAESDIVSLHCPLTEENKGFVDAGVLSLMKPSAIFINTARGLLVNEVDLAAAIIQGRIAGAGLDVLSEEPPPAAHPLIGLDNCIVTPHNAWMSREARRRLMETTLENVKAGLAGQPQHVVNR